MIRCWRLDDDVQTLVLGAEGEGMAGVVYWGAALPQHENLDTLFRAHRLDITGGMLDQNPELSICPAAARTFPGQPGLVLRSGDGRNLQPQFRFLRDEVSADSLMLHYRDQQAQLDYRASFKMHRDTHLMETAASIASARPIRLDWLAAPVMPAPQQADRMLDFSGRWCGEFEINDLAWTPGMRSRENRTGRTGHEHFPGLIVPCRGTQNTVGEAYAFHYAWSGGHRMIAEELADGRRQVQFGHAVQSEVEAGLRFETASLYCSYSDRGVNGCAVAFQRHLRRHLVKLPEPARLRPLYYNCWEAVYFDHQVSELEEIATQAANLGAERFVLDDGWFHQRDDDARALSDWYVDVRKFPQGLEPLIDHVKQLGMLFGLWFEPEMISPDSDTYRQHPHWALGSEDQILGRGQKALDLALPEVQKFVFERISVILSAHDIDYIKWDHNRVLPVPDARQTRALYLLLDRLRSAFPEVEIESCASGGGRIDFGIMARTHRVWLSDSNDALERLKIQHNAALFLPAFVCGSHVGPRVCHTSGRVHDIRFRAWVAAQRHMGLELDPRELTDEEAVALSQVVEWWKSNRHWLFNADILRLDSSDPKIIGEQQQAEDGSRFVAFVGSLDVSNQILPRPIRLTGLEPQAEYRVELINREQITGLSRGSVALKQGPITLSGGYLMSQGLSLPWNFPQQLWVLSGTRRESA